MKRKRFWALAVLLGSGALIHLTITAATPSQTYSKQQLDEFKAKIKDQREELGKWLNGQRNDLKGIVWENAVAIRPREKGAGVGQGRVKIEEKWKRIKKEHDGKKIRFDRENSIIEILPSRFMMNLGGDDWQSYKHIAIEFGSFVFEGEPEAKGGPSVAAQPADGEYWAIWGHKETCPWEIFYEIEY